MSIKIYQLEKSINPSLSKAAFSQTSGIPPHKLRYNNEADKTEINDTKALHQLIRIMRSQITRLSKENTNLAIDKERLREENTMLVNELLPRLNSKKAK